MTQDYGVPTAYVPRPTARTEDAAQVVPMTPDDSRVAPMMEPTTSGFVKVVDKPKVDPVQKAVDDWIETQRKAKAWDTLREGIEGYYPAMGRHMDEMLESVKGTEK